MTSGNTQPGIRVSSIQKNDGTGVGFPPEIRVDDLSNLIPSSKNCLGWWYHMHVFCVKYHDTCISS